jgi:hypothetical protein
MMRARHAGAWVVVILTAALSSWSVARAEFVVRNVRTQSVDDRLLVSADLELGLTADVESAVNNGVPLVLVTEFKVVREGLLWNQLIDEVRTRYRLRFHTLSGHYIVESVDLESMEMFRSVDDALRRIGTLRNVALRLPNSEPLSTHHVEVRSRLDINALPGPLRPMAFLSSSWRLGSNWTQWQIAP